MFRGKTTRAAPARAQTQFLAAAHDNLLKAKKKGILHSNRPVVCLAYPVVHRTQIYVCGIWLYESKIHTPDFWQILQVSKTVKKIMVNIKTSKAKKQKSKKAGASPKKDQTNITWRSAFSATGSAIFTSLRGRLRSVDRFELTVHGLECFSEPIQISSCSGSLCGINIGFF